MTFRWEENYAFFCETMFIPDFQAISLTENSHVRIETSAKMSYAVSKLAATEVAIIATSGEQEFQDTEGFLFYSNTLLWVQMSA